MTIHNPSRDAWLAARRSGIGGSDIAAICGLSPYQTPYDVWLDKLGQWETVARLDWGASKSLGGAA